MEAPTPKIVSAAPGDSSVQVAPVKDALWSFPEIREELAGRRAVVFLDYDGTLTPIVARPELAEMSEEMRTVLRRLAGLCTVAIVSGRDLADVRKRVGLKELFYAGSHGFDIAGPRNLHIRHKQGAGFLTAMKRAARMLRAAVADVEGALVEPKRLAVAVHHRQVVEADVPRIEAAVDGVAAAIPELRKTLGKKVFELRPRLDWDKGKALAWLMQALKETGPDVVPFYFGDDATDEDGFQALKDRGITIYVGCPHHETAARYALHNPAEVGRFLAKLTDLLENQHGA